MSYNNKNGSSYGNGYGRGRPQDQGLYSGRSAYPSRTEAPAPAPEPTPVKIDPKSRDLIGFKDHYYGVDLLRNQTGPAITFTLDELHEDFMTLAIPSRDLPQDAIDSDPIWNKFEGKYVCLLGLKKAIAQFQAAINHSVDKKGDGKLSGKLLSNPTLKRALVQ